MSLEDNLTYLQKVAIKGEVAFALSTAIHDAELKYRIYLILKEVDEEFKPFLYEAFKEAVTFDTEIVDRLYLETLNGEVPVWLWIEKNIADIKESLKLSDSPIAVSKTSINKSVERKNLVESAFIFFARKASMASPEATKELCNTVLNDNKLSFLHTACYYIIEGCNELLETSVCEISERIFDCNFDIREVLSTVLETEAIKKAKRRKSHNIPATSKGININIKIDNNSQNAEENIADILSQKIFETFKEISSQTEKPSSQYVVQKVFNDSHLATNIRVCNSREEAQEFIENIKKEYPELQRTCNFIIYERKKGSAWGEVQGS